MSDTIDFDDFATGYIDAMLWANTVHMNEDGDLGSTQDLDIEISSAARAAMIAQCRDFLDDDTLAILARVVDGRYTSEHAGHDFALTRNGHGAGYWDRGLGEDGDRLTAMTKPYGNATLGVAQNDSGEWVAELIEG